MRTGPTRVFRVQINWQRAGADKHGDWPHSCCLLLSFPDAGKATVGQDSQRVCHSQGAVCLARDACHYGRVKWNKGKTEGLAKDGRSRGQQVELTPMLSIDPLLSRKVLATQ